MGKRVRPDSGIGIKPMSETGSKRLVRMAIQYAIDNKRKTVTLVHKGNIMKFTEGAFRDWGYEVAKAEFRDQIVTEDEVGGRRVARGEDPHQRSDRRQRVPADPDPDGRLRRVRHAEPQRRLPVRRLRRAGRRTRHGAGRATSATRSAFFEATHGTAPKYAGKDVINPASVILSGVMMFRYLGWTEVADLIERALETTIRQKKVTYDLARQMEGATELKTSAVRRRHHRQHVDPNCSIPFRERTVLLRGEGLDESQSDGRGRRRQRGRDRGARHRRQGTRRRRHHRHRRPEGGRRRARHARGVSDRGIGLARRRLRRHRRGLGADGRTRTSSSSRPACRASPA